MNAYYNKQASNGYNLLSILSLGDNFYYTGQDCNEYDDHWSSVYGSNLTSSANDINWIATMGNHDWGDSDQWAMCGMIIMYIFFGLDLKCYLLDFNIYLYSIQRTRFENVYRSKYKNTICCKSIE